jgi:hypothetical protein
VLLESLLCAGRVEGIVKPISHLKGFAMKNRIFLLTGTVLMVFLGFTIPSPAIADSIWTANQTISPSGQSSNVPSIALDASGQATVVWVANDGDFSVIQSSRKSSTGTWSVPVVISLANQNSYDTQVVVDSNGLATAIWVGLTESGGWANVQSSHSSNGGAWSTPVSLSSAVNVTSPKLVVDTFGRAVAIWHGYDGTFYKVQTSNSLHGGAWSTPVTLGAIDRNSYWPKVAVNSSGEAVAVWLQESDSGLVVDSSRSLSGGAWTSGVDISGVGLDPSSPTIAIDSLDRKIAVWSVVVGGKNIIQTSYALSGGAWSSPVYISGLGADSYTPGIAIDSSGRANVVWIQVGVSGHLEIETSNSIGGVEWSPPQGISTPSLDSGDPIVSIAGTGRAFAIWHSFDSTTSSCSIQVTDSLNGGSWATPVNLGSCGDDISRVSFSTTLSGKAIAVWDSNAIGAPNIQKSELNEPVDTVPDIQLAATGSNIEVLLALLTLGLATVLIGFVLMAKKRTNISI